MKAGFKRSTRYSLNNISQTGMAVSLGLSARGSAFPRFLASQGMAGALGAELEEKIQNPIKFQWVSPGAQQTGGVATVSVEVTTPCHWGSILAPLGRARLRLEGPTEEGSMPKTIAVEIRQENGVWYATSPDMPGFLLCHTDRAKLDASIYPAMKQLIAFKEKHSKPTAAMNRASDRLVETKELVFA